MHGEMVIRKPTFIDFFLTCVVGPIAEETFFRGPVLLILVNEGVIVALVAALFFGVLFGLIHRLNKREYEDGEKIACPWLVVYQVMFGGVLLGLLVIVTSSLFPAIIFHSLWNISACVIEKTVGDEKLVTMARVTLKK